MTTFRNNLGALWGSMLAVLLAEMIKPPIATAQTTLSDRYKQLPAPVQHLPGLPKPDEPSPEVILALWDLREAAVSAQTIALVNSTKATRDVSLYPLPPVHALSVVLKASYSIGIEWIVDRFPEFSATGRTCIVHALRFNPSAETSELLFALLSDTRQDGYPRDPEITPPYFDDRVCDNAYVALVKILRNDDSVALPFSIIEIDMPYPERDAEIAKLRQWWTGNAQQAKAALPLRMAAAPSVSHKLDVLILQLAAN